MHPSVNGPLPAYRVLAATARGAMHFDVGGTDLRFFSVVSTIGTPIDVTAQELRVEAFFPSDESTRARWTRFTGVVQAP